MHRVVAPAPGVVTKDGMLPDRYSIPYVSFSLLFPLLNGFVYLVSAVLCPRMSFYISMSSIYAGCAQDMSVIIDCIPGTWSADQPKKYEPVSVKEYEMKRFAANY